MQNQQLSVESTQFQKDSLHLKSQKHQLKQTLYQNQPSILNLIYKKNSINTAPFNRNHSAGLAKESSKYSEEELKLTSIELLQKQVGVKIKECKQEYPSSFALIKIPKRSQRVSIKQLSEVNFSVLSYSIQQLMEFSVQIIYSNSFAQFIFSRQQIEELVASIAINYNKISYHNFSHAFSLMQLNYLCIELMPKFKAQFSDQQLFCSFIAGLSHDLNHNGTNSMFQIKSKTDLALLYNNESVLQKMHISVLWKILRQKPSLNFLRHTKNQRQTKKIITKLIMSTDMNFHFQNLEQLQKIRKQNSISLNRQQDRMFIMSQLFHSCDLGNPTLEYESYISWAALLSFEFNQQAKLEQANNLEVTKSFQYKNLSNLYNDQVWFVDKVVLPLWKQVCFHLPELSVLKKRIEKNVQILNEKIAEEELKRV